MNMSLILLISLFWAGMLAWMLIEYLILRFEVKHPKQEQNSSITVKSKKRIIWFTDTISDLNGVSVTLRNIGWLSHRRGDDITMVSSLCDNEIDDSLPPNLINFKPLIHFSIPHYETLTAKIPNPFSFLTLLLKKRPDEVFISTPSFVGLFALIFAKILGIQATAIYHTDFSVLVYNILNKKGLHYYFIDIFTKQFYLNADRILVPSDKYIEILKTRGYPADRMSIFHRGIDTNMFRPDVSDRSLLAQYGLEPTETHLLFSGRISEDKKISYLIESVRPIIKENNTINLVFAGAGPDLDKFKDRFKDEKNIHFLGQLKNSELASLYAAVDLFVFPSEMDTFGMAVLEAQACGIPAIVSNVGGPQNIIKDRETGFVLSAADDNMHQWSTTIRTITEWIAARDFRYLNLCSNARDRVLKHFDFYKILDNYVSVETSAAVFNQTEEEARNMI